jgi:protein-arginine kinase activator protein McsA
LKCERCGEREAEVLLASLVHMTERNEAQTQQLCRVCANVDPAAWQAGLEHILKSGQALTPEQRSSLEGLAGMLKRLRPDMGNSGDGQSQS